MTRKRKLQHAERSRPKTLATQSKKSPNGAGSGNAPPVKKHKQQHKPEAPTIPFEYHQRILLIGEGDLSFAVSLIEHHGCANVTATVLEKDEKELLEKYPHAEAHAAVIRGKVEKEQDQKEKDGESNRKEKDNMDDESQKSDEDKEQDDDQDDNLEDDEFEGFDDDEDNDEDSIKPRPNLPRNNKLLFNIDATKPPPSLLRTPHDTIIFNFPHVGGKSTDINRQVRHNQSLLVSFFQRILPGLAPGGSIVVTLFEGEPYTLWNIRDLGRHAGLAVEKSFRFQSAAYPGYKHARTLGVVRRKDGEVGGGWRGEERAARSFVFRRKGDIKEVVAKKTKKGNDSSDDED
ncbi:Fc.00g077580.m01.CDS01 [Cosmosporella sp. VM-42]